MKVKSKREDVPAEAESAAPAASDPYIAGLHRELEGYERYGREDRAREARAEIARAEKAVRRDASTATRGAPEAATVEPAETA